MVKKKKIPVPTIFPVNIAAAWSSTSYSSEFFILIGQVMRVAAKL